MFGVQPTRPATNRVTSAPDRPFDRAFWCRKVRRKAGRGNRSALCGRKLFVELGNFVFCAAFLPEEYRRLEPDSAAAVAAAIEASGADLGFVTLDADAFGRRHGEIDRLRADEAHLPRRGSCRSLIAVGRRFVDEVWELSGRDAAGNAAQGAAVFVDTQGSYVANDKQLVECLKIELVFGLIGT